MKYKKRFIIFLSIVLIFPSLFASAATTESPAAGENEFAATGEMIAKDEVVYASLLADGAINEIYVINILDFAKAGTIVDYGPYSSVKNLTDLSEITLSDDTVKLSASKGKFYYQGNIEDGSLPWDVNVSYVLDGDSVTPNELPGQSGHLKINIETAQNTKSDSVFYENYLLQVAVTLDSDLSRNIQAPGAVIANAGKNKQVTFTVMPGHDGDLTVEADVENFEMDSIQINALPSSMAISSPDVDEMTEDMVSLSHAIAQLNRGVSELAGGVTELNSGVTRLKSGSASYKSGLDEVNHSSVQLIEASKLIQHSLTVINDSLSMSEGTDSTNDFGQLSAGLQQLADGLQEAANGLITLKNSFKDAYTTLDNAMQNIPGHTVSEEEIDQLYSSGANKSTIDKLLETYTAAQTAKGTYQHVKPGFEAVEPTLTTINSSLEQMSHELESISDALTDSLGETGSPIEELTNGIARLTDEYAQFHIGIESFTNGVAQLANSYGGIHSGIESLEDGTSELHTGVRKLQSGTNDLHEATNDLPEQMQSEIDAMIKEYDKSDFEPVSFVSNKNSKINAVQFIIQTEKIALDKEPEPAKPKQEEKGFWARLKDLFA